MSKCHKHCAILIKDCKTNTDLRPWNQHWVPMSQHYLVSILENYKLINTQGWVKAHWIFNNGLIKVQQRVNEGLMKAHWMSNKDSIKVLWMSAYV
jgi:hypothetical protein